VPAQEVRVGEDVAGGAVGHHGPVVEHDAARAQLQGVAKVRSIAHRRGITANPRWSAGLRTMCSVVCNKVWAQSSSRPANAPSANTNRTAVRR
jgi:hypothetical protein